MEVLYGICLEVLRKTTKGLSQDNRCPGRDSIPEAPEYEAKALPLGQPVRFHRLRYKPFMVVVWYTTPCSLIFYNLKMHNMNSVLCLPLVL
jgi:hypothetical protein